MNIFWLVDGHKKQSLLSAKTLRSDRILFLNTKQKRELNDSTLFLVELIFILLKTI